MLPLVKRIDIPGFNPGGQLTTRKYLQPGEQELLLALIDSVETSIMIEFGVNDGLTAQAVLRNVPTIERYIGVDVEPDYQFEILAQSNERPDEPGLLVKDDPRFELIVRPRGSWDLTIVDLPRADFVFIDGDHGFMSVKHDSDLAFLLVRPGGMIAWHDYGNNTVSVTTALDQMRDQGWNIQRIEDSWLAFERFV